MILIGTTLAAYVMDRDVTWGAWLRHAEEVVKSHDAGVHYFAAIEIDARGLAPFEPLTRRLEEVGGSWWTWSLDDGRTEVTTGNRLRHITVGQNLVFDWACANQTCTHVLFLAADCEPPPDVLPKLLEVDRPVVGAHCPTYCLPGVRVPSFTQYSVTTQVAPDVLTASAACMMFTREAFRHLRWRWDVDAGMSDDPCMQHDAWHKMGWPIYVRNDVITRHHPEAIPAIEHRGHDRTVVW